MNKRGQIYILVALILAVAFYILLTKTNLVFEVTIEDDFEELSKNYDLESAKFVNSLLAKPGEPDVEYLFFEFTKEFAKYSKIQNPDFGLIYVFNYKGKLYVGNYLAKGDIFIQPGGTGIYYVFCSCQEGGTGASRYGGFPVEFLDIPESSMICCYGSMESGATSANLVVDGILYKIPITADRPELIIIGSEIKGEQKKVYVEEFIPGDFVPSNFGNDFCNSISASENKEIRIFGGGRCSGGNVICSSFYENNKQGCMLDENCCWDKEGCVSGEGGICK